MKQNPIDPDRLSSLLQQLSSKYCYQGTECRNFKAEIERAIAHGTLAYDALTITDQPQRMKHD